MPQYNFDYSTGQAGDLYSQIAKLQDPFSGLTAQNFGARYGIDPGMIDTMYGGLRKQLGGEYGQSRQNALTLAGRGGGSATPGMTTNALDIGKFGALANLGGQQAGQKLSLQNMIAQMLMDSQRFGANFGLQKRATAAGGFGNLAGLDLQKQQLDFQKEQASPGFLDWLGGALGSLAPIAGALLAPATGGLSLGLGALGGGLGKSMGGGGGMHSSAQTNQYSMDDLYRYMFGGK